MGYLGDMYGKQSPDFVRGVLAAMEACAVWRDGKQFIGVMETPLKQAMFEATNDLAEHPPDFKEEIERVC